MPEHTTPQQGRGRFRPGQSGNPADRPRGSVNQTTAAAHAILLRDAAAVARRCVDMALAGDPSMIRVVLERLIPPAKDAPAVLPGDPTTPAEVAAAALRLMAAEVADLAERAERVEKLEKTIERGPTR